jgi:hypothetical protein
MDSKTLSSGYTTMLFVMTRSMFRKIPPLDPKLLVRGHFKGYENENCWHLIPR